MTAPAQHRPSVLAIAELLYENGWTNDADAGFGRLARIVPHIVRHAVPLVDERIAELVELREDKARLDAQTNHRWGVWFNSRYDCYVVQGEGQVVGTIGHAKGPRAALDEARKAVGL